MATYIVGDVQGCYDGLRKLLNKVDFSPNHDRLIAVGDLIGRGNQPLETLDYLHSLKDRFDTVLGNHDLHLFAIYAGIRQAKPNDKLDTLLNSSTFKHHIDWLRRQPLALLADKNTLVTHAGLYPNWSFEQALNYSQEVSKQLQAKDWTRFLGHMYGNQPAVWNNALSGSKRLRFIVNAMSRMRYIENHATLEFQCKTTPDIAPNGLTPWFRIKNDKLTSQQKVVFGHWASLQGKTHSKQFIALDTGYVWGNNMTLLNLSTGQLCSVSFKE